MKWSAIVVGMFAVVLMDPARAAKPAATTPAPTTAPPTKVIEIESNIVPTWADLGTSKWTKKIRLARVFLWWSALESRDKKAIKSMYTTRSEQNAAVDKIDDFFDGAKACLRKQKEYKRKDRAQIDKGLSEIADCIKTTVKPLQFTVLASQNLPASFYDVPEVDFGGDNDDGDDEEDDEEVTETSPPSTTTETPTMTYAAPTATTADPEVTTAAPEVTTATPEVTTAAPEATTATPEVTTAAPESTTAAPEVTTAAPDTTSPSYDSPSSTGATTDATPYGTTTTNEPSSSTTASDDAAVTTDDAPSGETPSDATTTDDTPSDETDETSEDTTTNETPSADNDADDTTTDETDETDEADETDDTDEDDTTTPSDDTPSGETAENYPSGVTPEENPSTSNAVPNESNDETDDDTTNENDYDTFATPPWLTTSGGGEPSGYQQEEEPPIAPGDNYKNWGLGEDEPLEGVPPAWLTNSDGAPDNGGEPEYKPVEEPPIAPGDNYNWQNENQYGGEPNNGGEPEYQPVEEPPIAPGDNYNWEDENQYGGEPLEGIPPPWLLEDGPNGYGETTEYGGPTGYGEQEYQNGEETMDGGETNPMPSESKEWMFSPASRNVPPMWALDVDHSSSVDISEWQTYLSRLYGIATSAANDGHDPTAVELLKNAINFHYGMLNQCVSTKLQEEGAAAIDETQYNRVASWIEANCYVKFRYSVFAGVPPFEWVAKDRDTIPASDIEAWFSRKVKQARDDVHVNHKITVTPEHEQIVEKFISCTYATLKPAGDAPVSRESYYAALHAIENCVTN